MPPIYLLPTLAPMTCRALVVGPLEGFRCAVRLLQCDNIVLDHRVFSKAASDAIVWHLCEQTRRQSSCRGVWRFPGFRSYGALIP